MNCYPPEFRLRVLREVLEEKTSVTDVERIFGVSKTTIHLWLRAFRVGGESSLSPAKPGPSRPAPSVDARRGLVVQAKEEAPHHGTRRIADILRRFEGVGVSEGTVRRILHEEGLLDARAPQAEKAPRPETRFERAEPNQLWQSDIFTVTVRRTASGRG